MVETPDFFSLFFSYFLSFFDYLDMYVDDPMAAVFQSPSQGIAFSCHNTALLSVSCWLLFILSPLILDLIVQEPSILCQEYSCAFR